MNIKTSENKIEVELEVKEHQELRRVIPKAIAAEQEEDIIIKHTIGTFKINESTSPK